MNKLSEEVKKAVIDAIEGHLGDVLPELEKAKKGNTLQPYLVLAMRFSQWSDVSEEKPVVGRRVYHNPMRMKGKPLMGLTDEKHNTFGVIIMVK